MKTLATRIKKRFSNTNVTTTTKLAVSATDGKRSSIASNSSNASKNDLEYQTMRKYCKEDLLDPVPSFREVSPEKRKILFIKKLRLCSVTFDFQSESAKENLGKEMKRQILLELVDHITSNKGWFDDRILDEVLAMISSNLFRSLSPSTSGQLYDPDEDEPTLDAAWPHLQIVYEFLLRFIVSSEPDQKLLKRRLNGLFILSLLNIFRSEDPREREYLKTILHRIYGKFMSLRSFIRRAINNVFYQVIYSGERHNGIAELLEILGSIINGFALPLKKEHKQFLRTVLIPLHKTPKLQSFHQQLSYCVTQFIDKDNSLAVVVIGGLLKFWPLTSPAKEVLLLNELEEILEVAPQSATKQLLKPIFIRLRDCVGNSHFQVAERALFYWNNDLIGQLTNEHKIEVFPIIVPILNHLSKTHWNSTVHSLSTNVTRMLNEIDSELYQSTCKKAEAEKTEEDKKKDRQKLWSNIKKIASAKQPNRVNDPGSQTLSDGDCPDPPSMVDYLPNTNHPQQPTL